MSPITELWFIVSSSEELKYDWGFLNVGLIGQEITTFDSVALNNVNPEKSIIHIHLFSFGPTPDFVNMISSAPFSSEAISIHRRNTFEIPLSESRNHYHTQVYKKKSLMLFYGGLLVPKRKLLILSHGSLARLT